MQRKIHGMLLVGVALVTTILVGASIVSAASCTSGDGKSTCMGDCCSAGANWCVARPCY